MKIGIDARSLIRLFKTGIEYYTYHLINHLAMIDQNNEYILWLGGTFRRLNVPSDVLKLKKLNVKFRINRCPGKFINFLQDHYPRFPLVEFCIGKVDVFHSTEFLSLPQMTGKKVITIHDLTFIKEPNWVPEGTFNKMKGIAKFAEGADLIIADSLSTKNDIIEMLKIPEDKIRAIHLGVDKIFRAIDNSDLIHRIMEKYQLRSSYILYVGSLHRRKNLVRLIEAFYQLQQDTKIDCQLVLAGAKFWKSEETFKKVHELGLESRVIFTGYISEEDLIALMNGASVFTFVSLYEGFGLPPLEAMACGTPVIASNTSSLPEVVGDAGILVDPYNIDEIAQAIHDVLNSEALRAQMRRKGFERAKNFSWEKTARETLEAYEETC